MLDERALPALKQLEALEIPYTLYEHPPVRTMEDCEGIGSDVGAKHFKNLFLTNRAGTDFYLVLIRADKKFHTGEVSRQLGTERLCFGTEEQLMDVLGLLPGAVTPLALINDPEHRVQLAIDRDIMADWMLCMHPMVASASVAMTRVGLLKYIKAWGGDYRYITAGADGGEE